MCSLTPQLLCPMKNLIPVAIILVILIPHNFVANINKVVDLVYFGLPLLLGLYFLLDHADTWRGKSALCLAWAVRGYYMFHLLPTPEQLKRDGQFINMIGFIIFINMLFALVFPLFCSILPRRNELK